MDTPGQFFFGRDIIFNLTSDIDWKVITTAKQRQVIIDNFQENTRQVMHDYAIGDRFYAETTSIYRKMDYKKQGPYIITDVFKSGTVQVQRGKVNEQINIRRLKPHFDE